jgi:hypothetical protein
VNTRRLSQADLVALLAEGPVNNITGRETEFHPERVINIEPYVRAVPASELEGFTVHDDLLVELVYQTHGGKFDLINVMTHRKNVYLVVVIDNGNDRIHGHLLLDLNREYGLDSVSNT